MFLKNKNDEEFKLIFVTAVSIDNRMLVNDNYDCMSKCPNRMLTIAGYGKPFGYDFKMKVCYTLVGDSYHHFNI